MERGGVLRVTVRAQVWLPGGGGAISSVERHQAGERGAGRGSAYRGSKAASAGSQTWARYSDAKTPPRSMSVSKLPCSAIRPSRSTTIKSALRIVDSRCAMMNVVRRR